jgi:BolA protein
MSIQQIIEKKLMQAFSPEVLDVVNESFMHNVPPGSESHFKVVIVSKKFDGLRLIQRHRLVNDVLADELAHHIHALTMHTYTPEQWQTAKDNVPVSPKCLGGGKHSK